MEIFVAGCSKPVPPDPRIAAQRQKFSEIDANFAAAIREINAEEQAEFFREWAACSNRLQNLQVPETNIDAAFDFLYYNARSARFDTTVALLNARTEAQMKRSQMTNELLAEKLQWYFVGDIPSAESATSNDILTSISNLVSHVYQERKSDLALRETEKILAEMSNSIAQDAAMNNRVEIPADAKKAARTAQIEYEKRQNAQLIMRTRQEQAANATAISMDGTVFQVVDDGILVNYNPNPYEVEMGIIEDCDKSGLSDGSRFTASRAYPIGTYRYNTAGGSTRTVKRYTISLNRATEWRRVNR
jgi:hypothetical protein